MGGRVAANLQAGLLPQSFRIEILVAAQRQRRSLEGGADSQFRFECLQTRQDAFASCS